MSITNTASAQWKGNLKQGKGVVSTNSDALNDVPYDFKQRFEGQAGTNPEELIGAAHASCYSMALSMILEGSSLEADSIDTSADVTLEEVDGGFAVTKVHLTVRASIPGAEESVFNEAAEKAKAGCPISKLLNAEISLDAKLV
ncbi:MULTISPECIES: OsmC family protein [Halomonas]|uniref:OsmC family protein n=1 Tax=Halomonas TaxID=2745 RepID=UPI001A8D846D|nr:MULTISPECIES: OsmC family protein [Halomonas]MBN8413250.1 OsmC family protein [Halomonas litopenaei]MBY5924178.1 OsmC family protein [Halomonas sp. DP4Y7-2]MBY6231220.1 OsmC family protein [Halomonas sp. DP4Y7-1]